MGKQKSRQLFVLALKGLFIVSILCFGYCLSWLLEEATSKEFVLSQDHSRLSLYEADQLQIEEPLIEATLNSDSFFAFLDEESGETLSATRIGENRWTLAATFTEGPWQVISAPATVTLRSTAGRGVLKHDVNTSVSRILIFMLMSILGIFASTHLLMVVWVNNLPLEDRFPTVCSLCGNNSLGDEPFEGFVEYDTPNPDEEADWRPISWISTADSSEID